MKFVVADITNENFIKLSLDETIRLIQTYGWDLKKIFLQPRNYASSASYVWTWKAREIAQYCLENNIDVFVINSTIRPSVYNTLRDYFPYTTAIWDKMDLVLNIFEKNSNTSQARLQIEYARLRYELPRFQWLGKQLSNLWAGIWTRGPWEKIMETRKRAIRRRLDSLKKKMAEYEKILDNQRQNRVDFHQSVLIGYTNVWKSSLFEALTWKEVLVANKLFATLDNRIWKIKTEHPVENILVDTIGFMHGIPPVLVNSFLPTLNEIKYSQNILLVLDASQLVENKDYFDLQLNTLLDTLKPFEKDLERKNLIICYNKADKISWINEKIIAENEKIFEKYNFSSITSWIGSSFDKTSIKNLTQIIEDFN